MVVSIWNVALVLPICIIGASYYSYKIGVKRGAEETIQLLVEEGILTLAEEEEDN